METQKDFGDPFAVPGDTEKPWYELDLMMMPEDQELLFGIFRWIISKSFCWWISGGLWKNNNITDAYRQHGQN